jgi:hypothetical protein
MSYTNRIEEMIACQVAQFQAELELAKVMLSQPKTIPMPHGYPRTVYHPRRYLATPRACAFIAHTGGKLSNGTPKVLSMDLVKGYVLGAYNRTQAHQENPLRG